MALVKCSKCGREVSEWVVICPHCQNNIQPRLISKVAKIWKQHRLVAWLFYCLSGILLVIPIYMFNKMNCYELRINSNNIFLILFYPILVLVIPLILSLLRLVKSNHFKKIKIFIRVLEVVGVILCFVAIFFGYFIILFMISLRCFSLF